MIAKRKIVLVSLLKPVDDPRMYEKFALSMGQTNKYAINIIGFSAKNIPRHENIRFWPVFKFRRLSLQRLLSPLTYWQTLLKVKPELIILNSHDLLIVSCLYRILFGTKLIYDIRENYKQNIIWSSNLPTLIRHLLAWGVRTKEHTLKRMIVHFFVAEKSYLNECSFISEEHTLLENKASRKAFPLVAKKELSKGKNEALKLVYSGTIAESYGIFDCLELLDKWVAAGVPVEWTIIGYCPRQDTLDKLRQMVYSRPYIRLIGGDAPVAHNHILEALSKADYALISYRLNPSNQHCMPTRIWECLAYQVPMIMKKEHPWLPLLAEYQAGLAIDFQALSPAPPPYPASAHFYPQPLPDHFYWEWEAQKLLNALDKLI